MGNISKKTHSRTEQCKNKKNIQTWSMDGFSQGRNNNRCR